MANPNWNEFFSYNPETGVMTWKVKRPGPTTAIGKEVGSIKSDGRYRSFVIFKKRYYSHRVIWEMLNGSIHEGMCIDHIDGNGLNNRLSNLRMTTLSANQRNRRLSKNSKTGVYGVFNHAGGFSVFCAGRYVGYSKDFDKAVSLRRQSESENNYHPNHGRKQT